MSTPDPRGVQRDYARISVLLTVNQAVSILAWSALYTAVAVLAEHSLVVLWCGVAALCLYATARVAYIRRRVTKGSGT
ncbi:hypothetical protein L5I01_17390 [Gordonia sp. HY442]|uniref:hypothetical protein n=1 Tax=Gordonia zhenghanii TaxID=2911516 RepID=UPI001F1C73B8|nr:hypothetical protein [Gordonia zhenghanii]MCF8605131.1 hypothetical protein [Gordonia zhenghanii]